jgi:glycosyltransferase involved in cell wall biosynthesis
MRSVFRRILGTLVGVLLWAILRLALLVVAVTRPGKPGGGQGGRAGGCRLLLTGRMDSKNWCQAHLTPLERMPEISEIDLVVDGKLATGPKTRQFKIPAVIGWIKPRALVRSAWAVVMALRQKPDVIMAYSLFPPGVFALIAARLTGAASIVQLAGGVLEIESGGHATDQPFIPQCIQNRLVPLCHRICSHFDAVVVRGRKAEAYLREHLQPKRVEIIPGSVEPARFHPGGQGRGIDLVFIGRIVPIKQPDHIVEIVKRVVRKRPGLRVVIAGRGPLLEAMKDRVKGLGLEKNVCFAGHVEKVEGLLVRSRIFLLTSRSEGLSIALGEAMLAGAVPVVADVGDLSELVTNGKTGWLIQPGDFDAYAGKICDLLDDQPAWSKMSAEGRRMAFDYSAVDAVVRRWQRCLPDIIGRVLPVPNPVASPGPKSAVTLL